MVRRLWAVASAIVIVGAGLVVANTGNVGAALSLSQAVTAKINVPTVSVTTLTSCEDQNGDGDVADANECAQTPVGVSGADVLTATLSYVLANAAALPTVRAAGATPAECSGLGNVGVAFSAINASFDASQTKLVLNGSEIPPPPSSVPKSGSVTGITRVVCLTV